MENPKYSKTHDQVVNKVSSVSSATLISRILGYVRDMLIANFFGATMAADAFFVAYKIPNLLRRLLGEGSLSTSFIPVYTEYLTKENGNDSRESDKLIKITFGSFGIIFTILTIAGILFAPQIVTVIAPGFSDDPDKFRLTIYLTRLMFPFLMAICLGAIALGVLNSWRLFFIPAIAPIMLSISEIVFILIICPLMDLPIAGLAIGVVVGGFGQLLFQLVPIIKKTGFFIPKIDFSDPGIKRIGTLMLPAIIGLSVMQINSFVDTICATLLKEGSVTHLYYGNRLMQLPLALFGTAIATVALPMMSESAANNKMNELKETFSFSMRTASFLIIPAIAGLLTYGRPIISLLFERGAFLYKDSVTTAWVLSFYAIGLLFFAGVKIGANAFFSMQDTKTPVIIASIAMILNIALNIIVVTVAPVRAYFGAGGLALATSIASFFNFILLIIVFSSKIGSVFNADVVISIVKHIIAALVMAFAIIQLSVFLEGVKVYISVPAVLVAGTAIYLLVSYLLKTKELDIIKKHFIK